LSELRIAMIGEEGAAPDTLLSVSPSGHITVLRTRQEIADALAQARETDNAAVLLCALVLLELRELTAPQR